MNYNEIRRLYDNVDNDELVTQTAYEFKLFDDYYYQLFYSYSELDKGEISMSLLYLIPLFYGVICICLIFILYMRSRYFNTKLHINLWKTILIVEKNLF